MERAIPKAQYTVRNKEVQEHAAGLLREHLSLPDFSAKGTATVLLHVLFTAAARLTSICAACLHLLNAPSNETIRKALTPGFRKPSIAR